MKNDHDYIKSLSTKKKWTKKDREFIQTKLLNHFKEDRKVPLDTVIPFTEMLTIIYNGKVKTYCFDPDDFYECKDNEYELKSTAPTFRSLLKSIKYDDYGVVKFLFESYLGGVVYEYGNYCSKDEMNYVWLNGKLEGFA